jgi:hypothetical protein
MSEHITHTAVLDDCFRLMQASDEISDPLKEAAQSHRDFARLGSITCYGARFTFSLLDSFRTRWSERTPKSASKRSSPLCWDGCAIAPPTDR